MRCRPPCTRGCRSTGRRRETWASRTTSGTAGCATTRPWPAACSTSRAATRRRSGGSPRSRVVSRESEFVAAPRPRRRIVPIAAAPRPMPLDPPPAWRRRIVPIVAAPRRRLVSRGAATAGGSSQFVLSQVRDARRVSQRVRRGYRGTRPGRLPLRLPRRVRRARHRRGRRPRAFSRTVPASCRARGPRRGRPPDRRGGFGAGPAD